MHAVTHAIALRAIEPGDEPFLARVYGSTREEELNQVTWEPGHREAFLSQQFAAQHQYYREVYPAAAFQIVLRDGEPAGRLYVSRGAEEVRIIDIALLAEHRNVGIGTTLLRELMAEAAAAGKRLTIHVERFNPALRLYERLGFRLIEDKGVYLLLGWAATGDQPKTAS